MERARARTKRALHLQRDFERSRLEDELVAAAYEMAVPVQRRCRSTAKRPATNAPQTHQPPPMAGGYSA